jgi:hypothetical protein
MKKRRFCHNPRKKRGKFVCILQSDVDKLRTHTRALDDEEVKEDKVRRRSAPPLKLPFLLVFCVERRER